MSKDPLPKQVDVRKLVHQAMALEAAEPLASFRRFVDLLAPDADQRCGPVEIHMDFGREEYGVPAITGSLRADVEVICQRCLAPMPLTLTSRFALGVVWTEDQARALPKALEPVIVGDEPYDLLPLVEDELIISLPYTNYHDDKACAEQTGYIAQTPGSGEKDTDAAGAEERADNPFKVLEQLKNRR